MSLPGRCHSRGDVTVGGPVPDRVRRPVRLVPVYLQVRVDERRVRGTAPGGQVPTDIEHPAGQDQPRHLNRHAGRHPARPILVHLTLHRARTQPLTARRLLRHGRHRVPRRACHQGGDRPAGRCRPRPRTRSGRLNTRMAPGRAYPLPQRLEQAQAKPPESRAAVSWARSAPFPPDQRLATDPDALSRIGD
jgi:hypothetical protein